MMTVESGLEHSVAPTLPRYALRARDELVASSKYGRDQRGKLRLLEFNQAGTLASGGRRGLRKLVQLQTERGGGARPSM